MSSSKWLLILCGVALTACSTTYTLPGRKWVSTSATDLFEEWEEEIALISNARFKTDSKKKLRGTRKKYATLSRSMVKAGKSMDKVLSRFRDHVLYLKYNLNARVIDGLGAGVVSIGKDVKDSSLICNPL